MCSQAQTGSATITIDPTSVGGTISPEVQVVCQGSSPGALTLSGYTGSILMWQSSTNGGLPPLSNISNTTNTYSPTPTQSTVYWAVVQSGVCPVVNSDTAVISVIVPLNPTITTDPSPPTICLGQSATLTASSGTFDGPFTNGGWFNSSMDGWRVDGSDNINSSPANNHEGPWGRAPNQRTYGGRTLQI